MVANVLAVHGTEHKSQPAKSWAWKLAIILVATFLVIYFRRPDQLFLPYIWVEDGTVSLPQLIRHGWLYLADPVAGYLIVPSKLIQATAMTISASYYPEIAYWLTVAFHASVLAAIALSPTTLRLPLACALFTLLIPTDSEVFGTSHYAFWWGSLLLVPPLLWRRNADDLLGPRVAMVSLGGLSSPLVVALLPLYCLRCFLYRARNDYIIAAVAVICGVVQLYFVKSSGTHGTKLPELLPLEDIATKFFGYFIYWDPLLDGDRLALFVGLALIAAIAAATYTARRGLEWRHFVIVGALMVSIAISVIRVPVELINPVTAGPRYFFYPFIFLGWLIIELLPISHRGLVGLLSIALLAGLHQFALYGPRGHHAIDWKVQLQKCAEARRNYKFPVHFAGNRDDMWGVYLSPSGCKALIDRSIFP